MTDGLPRGLLTNSEALSGAIERIDYVAIEDIARLWRVYTTNKAVLADDVGRRLENFFWRIWGNGRISSNIRGSQVALLFVSISEGGEIRTTPTQSPQSRRRYLEEERGHIRHSPPPLSSALAPSPASSPASDAEGIQKSARFATEESTPSKAPIKLSSSQERGRDNRRPPPILKKPKVWSSNHLPKTARIVSPTTRKESELDTKEQSLVSSLQSGVSPSSVSVECKAPAPGPGAVRPASENEHFEPEGQHPLIKVPPGTASRVERSPQRDISQRPGRKKAAFAANIAATKRRPAVGRRKSSQSSSSNTSEAPSPHSAAQNKITLESPPPLPSLGTPLDDVDPSPVSPNSPSDTSTVKARTIIPTLSFDTRSAKISRSASPHQSKHSRDRPQGRLAMGISPGNTQYDEERAHQDWLVDRDFRSKFVERTRPSENRGLASLQTHRTKSSTALTAPASYQAHGTVGFGEQAPGDLPGKEKANLTFRNRFLPSKAPGAASEAVIDDDDDDEEEGRASQALTRSKSQLTLLLERDRHVAEQKKSKNQPQPPQPPRKTSS
ncbi:Protein of unknown function DUF1752, fungi [Lasallia pustulata]|uniref:Nitrogen regulatory protein areA GATA-like domain-containing protein n=1 Tax=Lasallia pustulata TaxID=136370 RepID=A0A1W5CVQ0_9LECA|nr:Protein of unknown function DUF1752, fungi [Lasallia pustulata]